MVTGLTMAINAGVLLSQEAAGSTAQHLRPSPIVRVATFGAPRLIGTPPETGVHLRPAHFLHSASFPPPRLVQATPRLIRPAHFDHVASFGAPRLSQESIESHAWWRINVTANNGAGNAGIGKCEMFGGYDRLNLCSGGTPSASSEASGNTAAESFDDVYSNSGSPRWVSTGNTGQLIYHFASPVAIQGVMLRNWFDQATQMANAFDVQFSDDGSAWTTFFSVTGESGWGRWEGRYFWHPDYAPAYSGSPLATFRYYREICFEPAGGPSDWAIAEIILRSAPAGSNLATGGTPFASAANAESETNAFDGNTATRWRTSRGFDETPVTIGYDRGSGNGFKLAEIAIRSRDDSDAAAGQAPRRGAVQGSNDATLWSSLWETNALTDYTAASPTRTFTDPLYI